MINITQYVGIHKDDPSWTPERKENAFNLLEAVSELQSKLIEAKVIFQTNPVTDCEISGKIFGGFRPQSCMEGSPHSAHKEGQAVDIFDPYSSIDDYLIDHQDLLEQFGIFIEHPNSTPGWSHWSTRKPGSGNHIFLP